MTALFCFLKFEFGVSDRGSHVVCAVVWIASAGPAFRCTHERVGKEGEGDCAGRVLKMFSQFCVVAHV